jgi:hypothetical protein
MSPADTWSMNEGTFQDLGVLCLSMSAKISSVGECGTLFTGVLLSEDQGLATVASRAQFEQQSL